MKWALSVILLFISSSFKILHFTFCISHILFIENSTKYFCKISQVYLLVHWFSKNIGIACRCEVLLNLHFHLVKIDLLLLITEIWIFNLQLDIWHVNYFVLKIVHQCCDLLFNTCHVRWEHITHLGFIKCVGLGSYITDSTKFLENNYTLYNTSKVC